MDVTERFCHVKNIEIASAPEDMPASFELLNLAIRRGLPNLIKEIA